MKLPDLTPRGDVKGGAKTPPPMPLSEFESGDNPGGWHYEVRHNGSSVWKTIALCLIAANLTGAAAFFTLGIDNVKHSEIDSIMATRAPYIHDKQRIQENFDALKAHEAYEDNALHELEKLYYRDHPQSKP